MTTDELRALDAEIHQKVMGHRVLVGGTAWEEEYPMCADALQTIPHYSSEIAAAWQVVDEVRKKWPVQIATPAPGGWCCEIGGFYAVGNGNTAPLAICLAAKRLLELEAS